MCQKEKKGTNGAKERDDGKGPGTNPEGQKSISLRGKRKKIIGS